MVGFLTSQLGPAVLQLESQAAGSGASIPAPLPAYRPAALAQAALFRDTLLDEAAAIPLVAGSSV